MKKLIYLFLAIISVTIYGCRENDVQYSGKPLLHFSENTSSSASVTKGGGNVTVPVTVGSIIPVNGDQNFQLVVDTEKSTAKEGVDFVLVNNGTGTISSGKTTGVANVTLLESGATLAGKKVVFKIKSSTLENAIFDDTYTLNIQLACPYSQNTFIGNYKVLVDDWADYKVGDMVPVKAGSNPNEIRIMATNNTSLDNSATAYMIVNIKSDGTATVTSNEPFKYGSSSFPVTGSGTVDLCSGNIDLVVNYGTSYKNQKFRLTK